MPHSRATLLSPGTPEEVRTIVRSDLKASSCCTSRARSKPGRPGIIRSIETSWNGVPTRTAARSRSSAASTDGSSATCAPAPSR